MGDLEQGFDALTTEFEMLTDRGMRSAPRMLSLLASMRAEVQDLARQRQDLASLYDVSRDLVATFETADLLTSILDKAIVLSGAERGFVVVSRSVDAYRVGAARRFAEGEVEDTDQAYSTSIIKRVMQTREPILTTNVQDDGRFELSQSIVMQDIRSVAAVPLVARGELEGAIYVDSRMSVRHFDETKLELLQALASPAAMALRNARLYEDVVVSNERLQKALSELREAQSQLVQAERLAAVGRLAASVAHELRNPLMVMRNAIYFLNRVVDQGKMDSPDLFKRYFAKLDSEVDRQGKIINDLLFFSRNRPRKLDQVDLNAVIEETMMRVQMPESVDVTQSLAELDPVRADGEQLQQVFVNLVTNAVQAMSQGGHLTVRTEAEGDFAVVTVADTGVGISPENVRKLFEPFFTTKEKGIGLGLSVTRSIIEAHRGTIEVESEEGVGTTFSVKLPFQLVG